MRGDSFLLLRRGGLASLMGQTETFDHTADLGLRIRADDLGDLFQTAAEGLFDVIVANRDAVRDVQHEQVTLAAESTEDLLIEWLNELIFRSETEHRLYGHFNVTIDADGRALEAVIRGEPIDPARHMLDHEVKAVTHHGVKFVRDEEGYLAEVILDI
jgi:SHS2 domain-containing protein